MFIGAGGCKPARGRFKLRFSIVRKLSVTRPFGNKVLSLLVNAAIALHARVRGQSDYPANAVTARCTPDNSRLSTPIFDSLPNSRLSLPLKFFSKSFYFRFSSKFPPTFDSTRNSRMRFAPTHLSELFSPPQS